MKRKLSIIAAAALSAAIPAAAWAGEASTSATAGSDGWGPGTAAATAEYTGGGRGYTKTRARSGAVNLAQGVAVGFDRQGMTLSTSYAVAGLIGPAVGATFNVNIGRNGEVATSIGRTIAVGDPSRSVAASGGAGSSRGSSQAWASSGGRTGPRGEVRSTTRSKHRKGLPKRAILRRVAKRRWAS